MLVVLYYSVVREMVIRDYLFVNDEDEDFNTVFYLVTFYGYIKVAFIFIKNGVDVVVR